MSHDKELLRKRFSADPEKFYRVALFKELGFLRKQCPRCGGFFWTLDEERVNCPEQPCQQYEFLGSPATKDKYDYVTSWRKVESFFQKHGHQPVSRYPVVCRWRPDLYFTIASIVDFQRIESGKVVFEFPYNPLIVPQMCLRFSDIANVGVTGRHYTSFCMIGQHALANAKGYWKDRCVELDFKLLTEEFGIDKKEVVFKEDVWLGPGAFGNSLEYYVRGLELGNAVFTGFEGTPENYKEYPEKVIDMGAGLERFVWVSQGTYNSYDAVFSPVLAKFQKETGLSIGSDRTLDGYFKLAGSLDIDQFKGAVADYSNIAKQLGLPEDELRKKVTRIQAVYSIIDHTRTLLFGISDGMLPGNVGGGYNLRVILRRSLDFLDDLGLRLDLTELARWHAEALKDLYPELSEHVNDVGIILDVEEKKYAVTRERSSKIIETISKKKQNIDVEKLVELYDSDGITPDVLKKGGLKIEIPSDFYNRITSRHMVQKEEGQMASHDVSSLSPTKLIFYENSNQFKFGAKVLKVLPGEYVVLDSTAFFARAGGQEPDHGTINGLAVDEVIKVNSVVLHHVKGLDGKISQGDLVEGLVDSRRRSLITRHHTATHIINGASRKILGPWVWQHSAFKDIDMGRLDITHFAHLSRDQVLEIERMANDIVRQNIPVTITWLPRSVAEQRYGFRLYQGGAAPVKELRIVNIGGFDIEACGGTHVSTTGEVGLIKIIKSERVQDGVERLEYVAGEVAVNYVERQESILLDSSSKLETPSEKLSASISNLKADADNSRRNAKQLAKRLADLMVGEVPKLSQEIADGLKIYSSLFEEGLDSEYHLIVGDKLCKTDPSLVYIAIFEENSRTRIILFSGESAQKKGAKAGLLVKEIAKSIGGSGGGDSRFAQGGVDRRPESIPDLRAILLNSITGNLSKP
ncbi:MAG TPA: alanine--tRNA ligase [Nitrososphaerales archaeon]|nr:alanine--tRNA ligase [Nitrososphaerales archaeon]